MELIDTTIDVRSISIETLLPQVTPNFEIAKAFIDGREISSRHDEIKYIPSYDDARIALNGARSALGALNRRGYNPGQLQSLNQEYWKLTRRVESAMRRELVTH